MGYRCLRLAISSLLRTVCSKYTTEQVAELKKHHLSKNLYLQLPTSLPYEDLATAINNGEIDQRTSYRIDIGTTNIHNKPDFRSANACLDTFYSYTTGSEVPDEKLLWEYLIRPDVMVERKSLSKRVKLTSADEFMLDIYDSFLGIEDSSVLKDIFKRLGHSSLAERLEPFSKREITTELIQTLEEAEGVLQKAINDEYHRNISPFVFFVGATGLLPEEYEEAKHYTAEELNAAFPSLKLQKNELNGSFYQLNDNIISIFSTEEYVSITD